MRKRPPPVGGRAACLAPDTRPYYRKLRGPCPPGASDCAPNGPLQVSDQQECQRPHAEMHEADPGRCLA